MQTITENISSLNFSGSKIGLEKEGLRVDLQGRLANNQHPKKLGSALTHPCITTDFSESQLELITSPHHSSQEALNQLQEIETFTHQQLNDEVIWCSSMPCNIKNDSEINIARYGNSANGLNKTIYRTGLAHRYGKSMQVISGVHFNFSFPETLWKTLRQQAGETGPITEFINQHYMATIRNVQHYDWLLVYLFGASPATSASFPGIKQKLKAFDKDSYFLPYATSLRMGDLGYSNNFEHYTQHRVSYDSLQDYISSMQKIVSTQHPVYAKIPPLIDGQPQQLNDHLLQIENEHYTSVRPKQTPLDGESSLQALQQRGLSYIEIRSLDINPFLASGIELRQLQFMEIFTHFCLLKKSSDELSNRKQLNSHNLKQTASYGRDPALKLNSTTKKILLRDWAENIFDDMQSIAHKLDEDNNCDSYTDSLNHYHCRIKEPELTPSARILTEMSTQSESFSEFSQRQSLQHHDYYLANPLNEVKQQYYASLGCQSHHKQLALEASENKNCCSGLCQSA